MFYEFLCKTGLIFDNMLCHICGSKMKLINTNGKLVDYMWNCGITTDNVRCQHRKSIRHASWFAKSKLSFRNILIITYGLLRRETIESIKFENCFSSTTTADWNSYVREEMVDYIINQSGPIGGPGIIIEIDESKFGKRKNNRGRKVNGTWVFGGVERESGKCFLQPVEFRDRQTLTDIIKSRILPGTTIISDCWSAYIHLGKEGYEHLKVNHSLNFKDPETGAHTNTIEGTWRHVKASLPEYNRQTDFTVYLADYMFRKYFTAQKKDIVNAFIDIIRNNLYLQ